MERLKVIELLEELPPDWRGRWCGGMPCGCMGCANRSGRLEEKGVSKEEWLDALTEVEVKEKYVPKGFTSQMEILKAQLVERKKLRPCPFCGGVGRTVSKSYVNHEGERVTVFAVVCSGECGILFDNGSGTELQVADGWNGRVDRK